MEIGRRILSVIISIVIAVYAFYVFNVCKQDRNAKSATRTSENSGGNKRCKIIKTNKRGGCEIKTRSG